MIVRQEAIVPLSEAERARPRPLLGRGTAPGRALTHARILLKANRGEGGSGWGDAAIAAALEVGAVTVARVRQRCAEEGLNAALARTLPVRAYRRKRDGHQEARPLAEARGDPQAGHRRWTLRLLADRPMALAVVASVSHETVP